MTNLQASFRLALLAVAVLLGMSPWFAASASGVDIVGRYAESPGARAWLTGAVQLGFVCGTLTAAMLMLADLVRARWYFGCSAALAGLANLVLLVAPDYPSQFAARFATGFLLAGVYPPAMKMAATWFRSRRGTAIGVIVGALTLGKAIPFLLFDGGGMVGEGLGFAGAGTPVLLSSSGAAVIGGLVVVLLWRDGPYAFPRHPFRWGLVGDVVRDRATRLATLGYLGHMWEIYAFWAAVALFLTARSTIIPGGATGTEIPIGLATFIIIGSGAVGAVWAGVIADRIGRERVASWAMAASGGIALVAGWFVAAPAWLLLPLLVAWGTTVVADSAQFSALVTEVSPPHAVGTALTLQTCLGFALTTVSIWAVPVVAEGVGWGWAFALLAPGPFAGIFAMRALTRLRSG